MKILLVAITLFISGFQNSCFRRDTLTNRYDVVLGIGQSNMAGPTTIESQDSNSGAWLWNDTDWEKADGHLNRFTNLYAWNGVTYLSLMNSFGKEAALHNSRLKRTGLVVNAMGGTNIESWDSIFLEMSITRAKSAIANNPGNKITAILWHQGEANYANSHVWLPHFRSIRHKVDSLLGYDVPILVGGLSPNWYRVMNDTLRRVEEVHDCYYISSEGLFAGDGSHFGSQWARIFGLRYYQKYEQVKL